MHILRSFKSATLAVTPDGWMMTSRIFSQSGPEKQSFLYDIDLHRRILRPRQQAPFLSTYAIQYGGCLKWKWRWPPLYASAAPAEDLEVDNYAAGRVMFMHLECVRWSSAN